jgi:hypothetical protein
MRSSLFASSSLGSILVPFFFVHSSSSPNIQQQQTRREGIDKDSGSVALSHTSTIVVVKLSYNSVFTMNITTTSPTAASNGGNNTGTSITTNTTSSTTSPLKGAVGPQEEDVATVLKQAVQKRTQTQVRKERDNALFAHT